MMIFLNISKIRQRLAKPQILNCRQLWGYVAVAFNKVDADRLKLVGPDRLCAEWVLKNGGAVSLVQDPGKFMRDYNVLPPEKIEINIKEIDATDSSIMRIGLEHLRSCRYIDRMIIHQCDHLESDGLESIHLIKSSLKDLQVSSCDNLEAKGLMALKEMTNLKTLRIFDLVGVSNLNQVISELQHHLSGCKIQTSN